MLIVTLRDPEESYVPVDRLRDDGVRIESSSRDVDG
jgi:hypothetical protein